MQFDTKIAILVSDDLQVWQKLNVTALLMSGVVGAAPEIIGAPYRDAAGHRYHSLSVQPVTEEEYFEVCRMGGLDNPPLSP